MAKRKKSKAVADYIDTFRGKVGKVPPGTFPELRAPPIVERAEIWFDSAGAMSAGFTTFVEPYCGVRNLPGKNVPVEDFRSLLPFLVERFEIRRGSEFFTIDSILIGDKEQIAVSPILARVFQEGNEMPFRANVIQPGLRVAIRVTNFGSEPLRFRARFLGFSLAAPESRS